VFQNLQDFFGGKRREVDERLATGGPTGRRGEGGGAGWYHRNQERLRGGSKIGKTFRRLLGGVDWEGEKLQKDPVQTSVVLNTLTTRESRCHTERTGPQSPADGWKLYSSFYRGIDVPSKRGHCNNRKGRLWTARGPKGTGKRRTLDPHSGISRHEETRGKGGEKGRGGRQGSYPRG